MFTVDMEIIHDFMEFMERIHFPDMHATGCFVGKPRKVLQSGEPNTFNLTYFHELKSENEWKLYNDTFRAKLKKDFADNFGQFIENGQLKAVSTAGRVDEVLEV
jgi:hypothetical protein